SDITTPLPKAAEFHHPISTANQIQTLVATTVPLVPPLPPPPIEHPLLSRPSIATTLVVLMPFFSPSTACPSILPLTLMSCATRSMIGPRSPTATGPSPTRRLQRSSTHQSTGSPVVSQRGPQMGASSDCSEVLKGVVLEYSDNTRLLVNFDLSSNQLVGEIPVELTNLTHWLDGERKALLRFKTSLLDESNRLSLWNYTGYKCFAWQGVKCDKATGHVIELDLRNRSR
ncbi:leucine-rich repeat receptor-like protein kinase family protein, partial [Striga asiatica]